MIRRRPDHEKGSFPWHVLGKARLRARDLTDLDARSVAGVDQTAAFVRNAFRSRGLRLAEDAPVVAFVALSTLALVREAADNGRTNEVLTVDAFDELLAVVRTLELAVAEYAPEEARS